MNKKTKIEFLIKKYLKNFSINDLIKSLTCLTNWNPNTPSYFKKILLYYIFLSNTPSSYSFENRINNYNDFYTFSNDLIKLIPEFISLEDFVPEMDWGEIRYYYDEEIYKMLYGSNAVDTYDLLQSFEIQHITFNNEYKKNLNISPEDEFKNILRLHDIIINNINNQPEFDIENCNINNGNFEIPPEFFWDVIVGYVDKLKLSLQLDSLFLDKYSIEIGKLNNKYTNINYISDCVFEDKLPKVFFIKYNNEFYPFLTREIIAIFFSNWGNELRKLKNKINKTSFPFTTRIGDSLFEYIIKRFDSKNILSNVSFFVNDEINEIIFDLLIVSNNKIFLFHIINPFKNIDNQLKELLLKVKDLFKYVNGNNDKKKFFLHKEKCIIKFNESNTNFILIPNFVIPKLSLRDMKLQHNNIHNFVYDVLFLDSFITIMDEIDEIDKLSSFFDYYKLNKKIDESFGATILDKFASYIDSDSILIQGAMNYDMISLDPHWGSNFRYRKLKEFWSKYPNLNYFDHPKSYNVEQINNQSRMISKRYKFAVYFTEIERTVIFNGLNYENVLKKDNIKLLNIVAQSIDYNLKKFKDIIRQHKFFDKKNIIKCLVFFKSDVIDKSKFLYLNHLIPKENNLWEMDITINTNFIGIRIVVDDLLIDELSKINNRIIENKLIIDFFKQINDLFKDDDSLNNIKSEINKTNNNRPSFKMEKIAIPVSFPDNFNIMLPQTKHFKKSRKCIANMAKDNLHNPGIYNFEDGINKANKIRDLIIIEINRILNKFNKEELISFILSQIDGLIFKDIIYKKKLFVSLNHEIDCHFSQYYPLCNRNTDPLKFGMLTPF